MPTANADLTVVILETKADAKAETCAGIGGRGDEFLLVPVEPKLLVDIPGISVPATDDFTVAFGAEFVFHSLLLLVAQVVT